MSENTETVNTLKKKKLIPVWTYYGVELINRNNLEPSRTSARN